MSTLASELQDALVDFFAPLADGARDSRALAEWLAALGQTGAVAQNPALIRIAQNATALVASLSSLTEAQLASWDGLRGLLDRANQAKALWADLRAFAANPALGGIAPGLAEEIMALLLASYLRRRHGVLFRLACLLALIEPAETATPDAPVVDGPVTRRYSRVFDRLRLSALGDLLSRPGATLAAAYLPNGMASGADAWVAGERMFSALSLIADEIGLAWQIEHRPVVPPTPSTSP
ncbi:MAG: hypothetical protein AB7H71_00615, partial [Alphaproteobacteria bacterium]